MSLSWDPDDASTDEPGWGARLGAWFSPSPAELAGLAVLLIGSLVLSGALWTQAVSRPTSFGTPDEASLDTDGDGRAAAGSDEMGPHDIGAGMDATGTADGVAPGIDVDGAADGDGGAAVDEGGGVATGGVASDDGGDEDVGRQVPGSVVVHVTGAVRTAGLVSLPVGARIGDAVVAAGGTSSDALVERVNLARVVVDGEHVHVPREGDDPTTLPPIGGSASAVGSGSGSGGRGGAGGVGDGTDGIAPIHLNRASAAELETLPGIGPARAEAIVSHREQQGPFATPGDLRAVSGIGEATFQRLAPLITVE